MDQVADGVPTTRAVPLQCGDSMVPITADRPITFPGMQIGKDPTSNLAALGPGGRRKSLVHPGVGVSNTSAEVPTAYVPESIATSYTCDARCSGLHNASVPNGRPK